ncbi:hypothetical protein [Methanosarcina sp. WWM596]|uniref:hypothetical protein n=1 Tax=Methanosarcina sp. WWM596 TaxID=1434103 RepID=UPI000B2074FE|nr:hypothetical protein [Methanosarcina sp. WWM596]
MKVELKNKKDIKEDYTIGQNKIGTLDRWINSLSVFNLAKHNLAKSYFSKSFSN